MFWKKRSVRWNTMRILAFGFLGLIFLGALLLKLPVCNREPITFMDALFTATTAVCVTGLVTVTPAVQFTVAGKIILLILIQIGGLGVVACTTAFFFLLRRKLTMKERIVIQESYNADHLGGMVEMVWKVLVGTMIAEGAGAVLYGVQFVPEYGLLKGVGYSIFHSVSAFCNAGIDILGDSSLAGYVTNPLINITTILLIILGGIGFTVWFDVMENLNRIRHHEMPKSWMFTRLRLHSKLALVTTAFLLVVGTGLVFGMEYSNPETLGSLSLGQKIMAAVFQSVTTRTAGFLTISQQALRTPTKLISCVLMFIGGSPGGTAGGIKTTTIAMLILVCLTVAKGGNDTECFGRRIAFSNFRTGFTVAMMAFLLFLGGVVIITASEPDTVPVIDIIFEAASAIGTAGLSAGLTPHLSRVSQCVIMVLMYTGRIGPVTLALVFTGKKNPRDRIRELPEERIMVG